MNGKSILVASAAAALFLSGAVAARAEEKTGGEVRCAGLNACKGQGGCASAHNECKGKNACKGQGITKTSAEDCKAKGGTVAPEMKK